MGNNPFHMIEDEEIAEIFEEDISRGSGCRTDIPYGFHIDRVFTREEEEALACIRRWVLRLRGQS